MGNNSQKLVEELYLNVFKNEFSGRIYVDGTIDDAANSAYHVEIQGFNNGDAVDSRINQIPYLGNTNQIRDVANDNQIHGIVIALASGNSDAIPLVVSDLADLQLRIHVLPNLFSILSGHVKMESFGRSMIEVKRDLVPPHVVVIKRLFDTLISLSYTP